MGLVLDKSVVTAMDSSVTVTIRPDDVINLVDNFLKLGLGASSLQRKS